MPTPNPTDAQIDAHVLAEGEWEDLVDDADEAQDEELPAPATVDYMDVAKNYSE